MSTNPKEIEESEALEELLEENAKNLLQIANMTKGAKVVTWDNMKEAAKNESAYQEVKSLVLQGNPLQDWPKTITLRNTRNALSVVDGLILYGDRILVPTALRKQILANLHCGHQGSTSMSLRANASVFWPRIGEDILHLRDRCKSCRENAPSQPAAPPQDPPRPDYLFQLISTDDFQLAGKHYIVIIDRYSGWASVHPAGKDGARELVRVLRNHAETFGTPDEICTDGGPQYASEAFNPFTKN